MRSVSKAAQLGMMLRKWRLERGLKRTEVITELEKLGVDMGYSYLAKLESGERSLAAASLEFRDGLRRVYRLTADEWELETGLHVPVEMSDANVYGSVGPGSAAGLIIPGGLVMVPVYGSANGGTPSEYGIPVDPELVRGENTRAYEVTGNSMDTGTEDGIRDGEWVLVDTSLTKGIPGRVFLLEIIGDGMTVKRLRVFDGEWIFASDNPAVGEAWRADQVNVVGQVYGKVNFKAIH